MAALVDAMRAERQRLLADMLDSQQRRRDELPSEAVLWMAVSTGWTIALAQAAAFPAAPHDLQALFDKMVDQDLCSKRLTAAKTALEKHSSGGVTEAFYVMGARTAHHVLGELKRSSDDSLNAVLTLIAKVGQALLNVEPGMLTSAQRRWAELASRASDSWNLENFIRDQVDEALTQARLSDAVAWTEAMLPIEALVPERFANVVQLASLRIHLRKRQADSERFLRNFIVREEQIEAFDRLLTSQGSPWALHYVGAGGVGKTSLMRYLQAKAAPKRGASTARVDFDYLNPEYPSRKPALLLLQLAEELRLHDRAGRAATWFSSFSDKAVTFHEGLEDVAVAGSPLELVRDPQFQLLLQTFAFGARELPQPIIIILDTCEELAKLLPDGKPPSSVTATFAILESLHEELPELRVIFSGRRPLAAAGARWRLRTYGEERETQEIRSDLALHEILGFSFEDATSYLRQLGCPAHLVSSILLRCVEKGYVSRFTLDPITASLEKDPRYNPFELGLYGVWAREDPSLTPEVIASTDVDPYVKTRIVGRLLNPNILRLLPAMAWLGRFQFKLLGDLAIVPVSGEQLREIYDEIAAQEWVERQHLEFLEIERGLQPRLLKFLLANEADLTEQSRIACVEHLGRVILERPLVELPVSYFEAMLRMLVVDPLRAASWWDGVEQRVLKDVQYDWILQVTRQLLADEHWTSGARFHIRGAVRATHAAALLHAGASDVALDWQACEADLDAYPTEAGARRLRSRAQGGRGLAFDLDYVGRDEQLAANVLSGLEAQLRFIEPGHPANTKVAEALRSFGDNVCRRPRSDEIKSYSCILVGIALLRAGRFEEAQRYCSKALAYAANLKTRTSQMWLDWRAPDSTKFRVRLEFLRAAYPALMSPTECVQSFQLVEPTDLDVDRFDAALLLTQSAIAPLSRKIEAKILRASRSLAHNRTALSAAHRQYPPLYVVAAIEQALTGAVTLALDSLREQVMALESIIVGYGDIHEADRAVSQILHRFRLGYFERGAVSRSDELADRELEWKFAAMGPSVDQDRLPSIEGASQEESWEMKHARWRTVGILSKSSALAAVKWAEQAFEHFARSPRSTFAEALSRQDLLEIKEVAVRFGISVSARLTIEAPDASQSWQEFPHDPMEAFTLRIRAGGIEALADLPDQLIARIGMRRVGTLALEEGELLALRLPERGIALLGLSAEAFSQCGDRLQSAIASICKCLALARCGRVRELAKQLDKKVFGASLWIEAERIAEQDDFNAESETAEWSRRLAACLAITRDLVDGHERRARVLRTWNGAVPAEVAGWLEVAAARSSPKGPSIWGEGSAGYGALVLTSMRGRVSGSALETTALKIVYREDGRAFEAKPITTPPAALTYSEMAEWISHAWAGSDVPQYPRVKERTQILVVDRGTAWLPWEAILTDARHVDRAFRRRSERVARTNPIVFGSDLSIHTLTTNHAGADIGGSSLGKLGPWSYKHGLKEPRIADAGEQQILHIFADPVETTSGIRLRLGEQSQSLSRSRGEVIRAEELVELLPNPVLCLLQLVDARGERTGADREKAGLLRSFAAELHERGMPVVITVPSVTFNMGVQILRTLTEAVDARGTADDLLRSTADARRTVFSTDPRSDALECAFDICFYGN